MTKMKLAQVHREAVSGRSPLAKETLALTETGINLYRINDALFAFVKRVSKVGHGDIQEFDDDTQALSDLADEADSLLRQMGPVPAAPAGENEAASGATSYTGASTGDAEGAMPVATTAQAATPAAPEDKP